MECQLIWSHRARADLEEINDYLKENYAAGTAARTMDEIMDRVEMLKTLPRMGRVYTRAGRPETRVIVCGKYRIFYDVREPDAVVEILTVRHHARDEPDLS